jgi:hypothetical protein
LEDRSLHLKRTAVDSGRQHAHGDVRRIERVMAERRGGVLEGRRPVHERDRAERRITNRCAGERQRVAPADRLAPRDRRLHQKIMRMLPVDQRQAVERLADLEDLAIPIVTNGQRIEAEHQAELQRAAGGWSAQHAHPPVLRAELFSAARPPLVVVGEPGHAVLHEMPGNRIRGRLRVMLMRIGLSRGRERHGRQRTRKHGAYDDFH